MASRYDEIMKTKPYLPYNMGDRLTEAMIAKAKEELGETEEVRARTIPELRQLVQAEKDLVFPTDDDAFLLQYLRTRKFDVKKAYSVIKNTYSAKKSNPDMYGRFDPEATRRVFSMKAGFILPYRDEEGCAIGVLKMQNWDVDVAKALETITALTFAAVMVAQEPANQVCGVKVLVDARGASLKQIRSLIPRYVILLAKGFTNSFPIRFKGFHIYNESPIFTKMITIMKLFLSKKIKNRFHTHGDSQKSLHKCIPKAILPAEGFGGDNPDDVGDWLMVEVEKYFELFHQMDTYGYRQ